MHWPMVVLCWRENLWGRRERRRIWATRAVCGAGSHQSSASVSPGLKENVHKEKWNCRTSFVVPWDSHHVSFVSYISLKLVQQNQVLSKLSPFRVSGRSATHRGQTDVKQMSISTQKLITNCQLRQKPKMSKCRLKQKTLRVEWIWIV